MNMYSMEKVFECASTIKCTKCTKHESVYSEMYTVVNDWNLSQVSQQKNTYVKTVYKDFYANMLFKKRGGLRHVAVHQARVKVC